jgi:tetratricopeptide (TPR) repeat protein
MTITTLLVMMALTVAASEAGQQAPAGADLGVLSTQLEKAALNDDAEGVKAARAACLRMLPAAKAGPEAAMVRYTIAYAGWRLAFSPAVEAAEQIAMLADAETQLNQALVLHPSFAEAYGLLSSVLGAQISKNPELGATLGAAAGQMLARARALDPNSPRLLMAQGTTLLRTPVEYGGDPQRAETFLRQALQAFDKEAAGKQWPSWGKVDTHVWLGQLLEGRGDTEGARAEYKAALALAPGSARVKRLIAQGK